MTQFTTLLAKIKGRESLTREEAKVMIEEISSGQVNECLIAAFLTALTMKGESVEEIVGLAESLRSKAISVPRKKKGPLIDLCGTGGVGHGAFNISTITSFVVAGAGLTVSKHGNRAITSKCGSADVLENLGVNINLTPEQIGQSLDELNIAFLFSPSFHPVMKYLTPVRKQLGFRTVFNLLGPLLSPVSADYQLMGVYDRELVHKVAKVFLELGTKAGMVVHGNPFDEITLTGPTEIAEFSLESYRSGNRETESDFSDGIRGYQFNPQKYNYALSSIADLKGGDIEYNGVIAKNILKTDTPSKLDDPKLNVVVINSAAALKVAGKATDFKEGISLAEESIYSGKALKKLNQLIEFSQSFK